MNSPLIPKQNSIKITQPPSDPSDHPSSETDNSRASWKNENSRFIQEKLEFVKNLPKVIKETSRNIQSRIAEKISRKSNSSNNDTSPNSNIVSRRRSKSKDPESNDTTKSDKISFPILESSQLKEALLALFADGRLKYLRDGSPEHTLHAINRIQDSTKYAVGLEIGDDVFFNDPEILKEDLKNLEYFQNKQKINKENQTVMLLISTKDHESFRSFRNLMSHQVLIKTKRQLSGKSGDSPILDEFSRITKYCHVLQKYEEKLLFFISVDGIEGLQKSEKTNILFKISTEKKVLIRSNSGIREESRLKRNCRTAFQKFLYYSKNAPERQIGLFLMGILLLSVFAYFLV